MFLNKMLKEEIVVDWMDKKIGKNHPVFIIAEAGVNHNGSLDLAMKLIDAAVYAGADAVKFQTFKSENLITKNADRAEYQKKNLGGEETQLQMLKKLELKYEDFFKLKNYCDRKGIMFLSTPHTQDTLNFLNKIVPMFKIGSGDLTNIPFLRKVASFQKPMILGTGMANLSEIKEALEAISLQGNENVVFLHCTTNYPCPLNEVNLKAMLTMQNELNCLIGYSDHTIGDDVCLLAQENGAVVLEKHFTLDKNMHGPDHKASANPEELKELISKVREQESINGNNISRSLNENVLNKIMGNENKEPTKSELKIMKLIRKSIISNKKINKGDKIEESSIIIKRPGTGLHPREYFNLIGKTSNKDIEKDELIKLEDLE